MKLRTVLALATALVSAGAARAADPAVVVQVQPVGKSLSDFRTIAEKFGGKDALEKFNEAVAGKLGEKGFSGLDLTRPVVGYLVNPTDPEAMGGVVVVPVTDEKEFLAFLKRTEIDAEAVKDEKGLYALEMPEGGNPNGKPIRLRFVGANAYVGVNVENADLAEAKLVAPEKLTVSGPPALIAVRQFIQKYPKDALEKNKESMKQVTDAIANLPVPDQLKEGFGSLMKLSQRMSEQQIKEGDTYDMRVNLDPRSYDLTLDIALKALPGTPLAKDLAARKATTNRFAGLTTPDTITGFATRLPLFSQEIRKLVVDGLKEAKKFQEDNIPEPAKAIADEAFAGLLRTVESGDFDLGFALDGPTKDDVYGFTLAVSFEDASGVEKELRAALKNLPAEAAGFVKLDAAKAGGVSIHTAAVGGFLPPDQKKLFGDSAELAFAFGPKGVYAALGTDAVAKVKAAVAAKPAAAPVLKVVTNGKRLLKFVEQSGKEIPAEQAAMFDKEDKQTTAMTLSVEGGDTLAVKFTVRLTPFFLAGAAGAKKD